jgi:hypothetical protein
MLVYKNDKNGTWYAMVRYMDWKGERKQKCQRGFATKREALDWERQFQLQKKADIDMTLESFCELYEKDVRPRLKESTWLTKESIRVIKMPQFLMKEMQDCIHLFCSIKPDDHLFPITKHYFSHEIDRGCKVAGVKRIRIHDLDRRYVTTTKNKFSVKADISNHHIFSSPGLLL